MPADDAIHIRNPVKRHLTLCHKNSRDCNSVLFHKKWPNPIDGCWTCLAQAELISNKVPHATS